MTVDFEREDEWLRRRSMLSQALTPASPVSDRELFAGRQDQMVRVLDTCYAPGEHAAIFGDRGVGKTSLATITEQIAQLSGNLAIRLNCRAGDRIDDLWRRVGESLDRRFRVDQASTKPLLSALDGVIQGAVELLTAPSVTTHETLIAFELITDTKPLVIFFDEFDRVDDPDVETNLVDLMKTISDQQLSVTLVIVGVADNVDSLIEEHESIGRGLNEIEMPRMSTEELQDILRRGLGQAEMTATNDASQFIAQLSAGLPHYVHLMGLLAGLEAIGAASQEVRLEDVLAILGNAVNRAHQHVSRLYYSATHSTRPNLYKEVLLAAALTKTDERGYFAPGEMREAMEVILDRPAKIPQFSDQLIAFAAPERGPVLQKTGVTNRPRYRMAEPLLVPYVIMQGVLNEIVTPDVVRRLLV